MEISVFTFSCNSCNHIYILLCIATLTVYLINSINQSFMRSSLVTVSGGCVTLRDWTRASEHNQHQMSKKKRKGNNARSADPARVTKTQLCYFHEHHPSGCQLTPQACRFAHGPDELRPGPIDHKQESLYKDNDT